MDATKIGAVGIANNAYNQQASAASQLNRQVADSTPQVTTENRPVADSIKVSSTVSTKNLDTVRAIELMHANLNQLAKGVRETNETVNTAVGQVDAMNNKIQEITKNYPPLPVDTKERNSRLMEYTSLRKELMSLMVPAPPPPPYEKVKLMWSSLFDKNNQLQQNLVPTLGNSSSDAQLKEASQTLEKTSSQLSEFSNKVTQALVQP